MQDASCRLTSPANAHLCMRLEKMTSLRVRPVAVGVRAIMQSDCTERMRN